MVKVFEIGSEYDWESTKLYLQDLENKNFELFKNYNLKFLRSGRDALRYIARAYKNEKKSILMPALCCSCMPEPFQNEGYEIIYYKLTDDFRVNIDDVLSKIKDDSIFLFMNYFAISSLSEENLKKITQFRKNVLTIEDVTHDFLKLDLKKYYADITICSIRKWFAIADGGLLFSKFEIPNIKIGENDFFASLREEAMKLKSEYLKTGDFKQKESFRNKLAEANNYLDNIKNLIKMNDKSKNILKKIDLSKIYKTRLENSKILFEKLQEIKNIKFLNKEFVESTLYFPIIISDQEIVQKELAKKNVYAPIIWPLPKDAKGICRVADMTAEHMLAIPCDHRYLKKDMLKIVEIISEILNN